MAATIEIEKSPWHDELPESPKVSDDEFAMKIALAPASRDGKPTVALLGAYRLPGRFGDMYGGRAAGATNLIAIETNTGRVWFNSGEIADAVPLEHVMDPDPAEPAPGAVRRVAIEGHFNIDLAEHLGLPPEKASYIVLAWIDNLVSSQHPVDVPENSERPQTRGNPPGRAEEERLVFRDSAHAPSLNGSPLALNWRSTEPQPTGPADIDLHGIVDPRSLPKSPPKKGEPRPHLTVMALGHRTRDIQWCSAPLPDEVIEARKCTFDIGLRYLVKHTDTPQRVFVLGLLGQHVSDTLVIEPLGPGA